MNENEEKKLSRTIICGAELIAQLRDITDGLVYVSETDSTFDVLSDGQAAAVSIEIVLDRFADNRTKDAVEEIGFSAFFDTLTKKRDWYGTREMERLERFISLRDLLLNNLADLHVFRVGRVQIDIYVVGLDANGDLICVKTKAVET